MMEAFPAYVSSYQALGQPTLDECEEVLKNLETRSERLHDLAQQWVALNPEPIEVTTQVLFWVCMVVPALIYMKLIVKPRSVKEAFQLTRPRMSRRLVLVFVVAGTWHGLAAWVLRS